MEWEKQEQEQIITNLKNDKENLLKLLSTDLQIQQANLSNKEQNTPELHQQLIAQIQVLVKN